MSESKWYPAAALSALIIGCGSSTDTGNATGGRANVDSGVPSSSGGMMVAYYGVLMTSGGAGLTTGGRGNLGGASTGGIDTHTSTVGGMSTGGFSPIPVYGPRFAGNASSSISTGGNATRAVAKAEGGAECKVPEPDLVP